MVGPRRVAAAAALQEEEGAAARAALACLSFGGDDYWGVSDFLCNWLRRSLIFS